MENATKALIMAGSVLIAILIFSAFIFMFRDLSSVQREKEELAMIEDVGKFNKSFESYEKEILGAQLLSLANKMDDYNTKIKSDVSGHIYNSESLNSIEGKDGYNYIVLEVQENGKKRSILYYKKMQEFTDGLEVKYGSLQNLEALYEAYIYKEENPSKLDIAKKNIETIINRITKENKYVIKNDLENVNQIKIDYNNKENPITGTYQYTYEQFKELKTQKKYKCEDIQYHPTNGRITKMTFKLI